RVVRLAVEIRRRPVVGPEDEPVRGDRRAAGRGDVDRVRPRLEPEPPGEVAAGADGRGLELPRAARVAPPQAEGRRGVPGAAVADEHAAVAGELEPVYVARALRAERVLHLRAERDGRRRIERGARALP